MYVDTRKARIVWAKTKANMKDIEYDGLSTRSMHVIDNYFQTKTKPEIKQIIESGLFDFKKVRNCGPKATKEIITWCGANVADHERQPDKITKQDVLSTLDMYINDKIHELKTENEILKEKLEKAKLLFNVKQESLMFSEVIDKVNVCFLVRKDYKIGDEIKHPDISMPLYVYRIEESESFATLVYACLKHGELMEGKMGDSHRKLDVEGHQ